MSAINIHVETQFPEDRNAPLSCEVGGDRLEAARRCVPELDATHNGLSRTVWIRRTIEDVMQHRTVYITDGDSIGKRDAKDRSRLYFVLDPPYLQHEIPWMPAAREATGEIAMIGMSGKMACPTWDLPAGSPLVGGSCPGATAGQTIVPLRVREKQNRQAPSEQAEQPLLTARPDRGAGPIGQDVRVRETICQICYAEGGNYLSPHVQVGEVVRYWWTREMMRTPEGQQQWVATMIRAIEGEAWKAEVQVDPRTGRPIYPMRVHSSGDFFSKAYARCWLLVAAALPEVMFWAPTRTWAAPGWMGDRGIWADLLQHPGLPAENFAIRPSAYHTGDPAPGPLDYPWEGAYLFPTSGTTSIYKFDDATPPEQCGVSIDPRYDWSCQTYSILDSAKSCRNAMAPDGRVGCRACWLHPELRVNYTTH